MMKPAYKKMLLLLTRDIAIRLALIFGTVAIVLLILQHCFHQNLTPTTATIVLGIAGATLASMGNSMTADATTRYGASGLPQWKIGNRLQDVGFAITLIALLLS